VLKDDFVTVMSRQLVVVNSEEPDEVEIVIVYLILSLKEARVRRVVMVDLIVDSLRADFAQDQSKHQGM
jgi:hypothetical protein